MPNSWAKTRPISGVQQKNVTKYYLFHLQKSIISISLWYPLLKIVVHEEICSFPTGAKFMVPLTHILKHLKPLALSTLIEYFPLDDDCLSPSSTRKQCRDFFHKKTAPFPCVLYDRTNHFFLLGYRTSDTPGHPKFSSKYKMQKKRK